MGVRVNIACPYLGELCGLIGYLLSSPFLAPLLLL